MIGVLLAAGLAACAVFALTPTRRHLGRDGPGHLHATTPTANPRAAPEPDASPPRAGSAGQDQHAGLAGRLSQRASAGLLGVAAAVVVGGVVGVVLGIVLAFGVAFGLGRLETAAHRRERLAIAADAPVVAELLSAALAAGVPVESAVPVVADAIGGPLGERLHHVARLLQLGQPGASAWARLGPEESLAPLMAATSRSARTGAPLAGLLAASADDLRQQAQDTARAQIRAAGVRSLLPLGLCLLPAFVLLGIVPLVGGLVARMWS